MNTFSAFSEGVSVLEASVTDDANFTVLTVVAGVVDVNSEAVPVVGVINVVVVDAFFLVDDDDVAIFDVVVVSVLLL